MTKFIPGKIYRTRNKQKARIYAIDCGGIYKMHGAIEISEGCWTPASWTLEGKWNINKDENDKDIVSIFDKVDKETYESIWLEGVKSMKDLTIKWIEKNYLLDGVATLYNATIDIPDFSKHYDNR